nr:replication enhancer protein [Cotton leaf curl Burewala virus]
MDSRTGEPITAAQAGNGAYIWEVPNPLYFKIISHVNRPFTTNMDILTIRIPFILNLRKALGIHKCFIAFRIWMTSQPPTGRLLSVFRTQVLKYLNNLGNVSINNVVRAVDHVLWNVLQHVVFVDQSSSIKFNIY